MSTLNQYPFASLSSVVSNGIYRFATWYDMDGEVLVAIQTIATGAIITHKMVGAERTALGLPAILDAHCYISIALFGDGNLMIAGNMHQHPFRALKTRSPWNISAWDDVGSGSASPILDMTGPDYDGVHNAGILCTYPNPMIRPDGSVRYMTRDNGISSRGDWHHWETGPNDSIFVKKGMLFKGNYVANARGPGLVGDDYHAPDYVDTTAVAHVTTGSPIVTAVGASFSSVQKGDCVSCDVVGTIPLGARILSVQSSTQLTMTVPATGTTLTGIVTVKALNWSCYFGYFCQPLSNNDWIEHYSFAWREDAYEEDRFLQYVQYRKGSNSWHAIDGTTVTPPFDPINFPSLIVPLTISGKPMGFIPEASGMAVDNKGVLHIIGGRNPAWHTWYDGTWNLEQVGTSSGITIPGKLYVNALLELVNFRNKLCYVAPASPAYLNSDYRNRIFPMDLSSEGVPIGSNTYSSTDASTIPGMIFGSPANADVDQYALWNRNAIELFIPVGSTPHFETYGKRSRSHLKKYVPAPPPPTPNITTSSVLPNAIVGSLYSATLVATGGTLPYTWSVIFGSLPSGLTLNSSTGVISGTPTIAIVAPFIIGCSSPGASSTKTFQITVSSQVYLIPETIDRFGNVDVSLSADDPTLNLNSWLATVPNGIDSTHKVTIQFQPGAQYLCEDDIFIPQRRHWYIDKNGGALIRKKKIIYGLHSTNATLVKDPGGTTGTITAPDITFPTNVVNWYVFSENGVGIAQARQSKFTYLSPTTVRVTWTSNLTAGSGLNLWFASPADRHNPHMLLDRCDDIILDVDIKQIAQGVTTSSLIGNGIYNAGLEAQHGFEFVGCTNITVPDDVLIDGVWGDALYFGGYGSGASYLPCNHFTVGKLTMSNLGRNGVTLNGILDLNMGVSTGNEWTIDNVGQTAFDLEPNNVKQENWDVNVHHGIVKRQRLNTVSGSGGQNAPAGRIKFANIVGIGAPIKLSIGVGTPELVRRGPYEFDTLTSDTQTGTSMSEYGTGHTTTVYNIDGFKARNCSWPTDHARPMSMFNLEGSTGIDIDSSNVPTGSGIYPTVLYDDNFNSPFISNDVANKLQLTIPSGNVGTPYSYILPVDPNRGGHNTPYLWSIGNGVLPVGLSLNVNTGEIHGTPTTQITSLKFTVYVTDALGLKAVRDIIVAINAAIIVPPVDTRTITSTYSATEFGRVDLVEHGFIASERRRNGGSPSVGDTGWSGLIVGGSAPGRMLTYLQKSVDETYIVGMKDSVVGDWVETSVTIPATVAIGGAMGAAGLKNIIGTELNDTKQWLLNSETRWTNTFVPLGVPVKFKKVNTYAYAGVSDPNNFGYPGAPGGILRSDNPAWTPALLAGTSLDGYFTNVGQWMAALDAAQGGVVQISRLFTEFDAWWYSWHCGWSNLSTAQRLALFTSWRKAALRIKAAYPAVEFVFSSCGLKSGNGQISDANDSYTDSTLHDLFMSVNGDLIKGVDYDIYTNGPSSLQWFKDALDYKYEWARINGLWVGFAEVGAGHTTESQGPHNIEPVAYADALLTRVKASPVSGPASTHHLCFFENGRWCDNVAVPGCRPIYEDGRTWSELDCIWPGMGPNTDGKRLGDYSKTAWQ